VPTLADTTIRLLGQEPLAGRVPVSEQLRLAEILDGAGFAYLEVSGGGCFDAAVKRGIESPWERIRALKARVRTPLGLALRGRFLVGARPVDADFARRFVASAAANGIDVFRLHDPLNDVSNLREAAEAVAAAERDFEAGLVYSPGRTRPRLSSRHWPRRAGCRWASTCRAPQAAPSRPRSRRRGPGPS
jgi:pyruvate/oxaloacetate carboxyltransferase